MQQWLHWSQRWSLWGMFSGQILDGELSFCIVRDRVRDRVYSPTALSTTLWRVTLWTKSTHGPVTPQAQNYAKRTLCIYCLNELFCLHSSVLSVGSNTHPAALLKNDGAITLK